MLKYLYVAKSSPGKYCDFCFFLSHKTLTLSPLHKKGRPMGYTPGISKDSPIGCLMANWSQLKSKRFKEKKTSHPL
jgi:hypothetical protein